MVLTLPENRLSRLVTFGQMDSAERTFHIRPGAGSEDDLSTSGRLRLFLDTVLPSAR